MVQTHNEISELLTSEVTTLWLYINQFIIVIIIITRRPRSGYASVNNAVSRPTATVCQLCRSPPPLDFEKNWGWLDGLRVNPNPNPNTAEVKDENIALIWRHNRRSVSQSRRTAKAADQAQAHGLWPAVIHVQPYVLRSSTPASNGLHPRVTCTEIITTHLRTPEGWKAELA